MACAALEDHKDSCPLSDPYGPPLAPHFNDCPWSTLGSCKDADGAVRCAAGLKVISHRCIPFDLILSLLLIVHISVTG